MNWLNLQPFHEEDTDVLLEEDLADTGGKVARIIIFNDDVNTFDWVIESLVEICKHNAAQAEQLAMIIHFKGKATVKTGSKKELTPMKDALCDRGLSAILKEEEI